MSSEQDEGYDPFAPKGSTVGVDKEEIHRGGGAAVSKPGMYHVVVESVSFESGEDKSPAVLMVNAVNAGTEESEVGKKLYHRIRMTPPDEEDKRAKWFAGIITLLFEFGVLSEEEAFGKEELQLSRSIFERLEGCQAIVKVTHRPAKEYLSKKTGKMEPGKESWEMAWNNDCWNIHHDFVKDVPKDWELANLAAPSKESLAADLDGI